jgi:UDP-glucuronate 4-epimerase
MSSTMFVTGAAGFIGSHLTRALLERGDRVIGLDNFDVFYDRAVKEGNLNALAHDRFTFVEGDIRDGELVKSLAAKHEPDGVFHIAALAGVRPSIEAPERYADVNVTGLVNVLEAARSVQCRNIAFASSSSVYGNNARVPFSEEDSVEGPISPYAATKRAGELICSTYCHLYGMSIAALRFFTVFGPSQRPDLAISKFMRLIADGEEVPMFGDGSTSRDYTYISDIIRGVLAAHGKTAVEDDGFFRLYNLGGSKPVMLSDMIEKIGAVVGRPAKIKQLPMQPGDVERTYADTARSERELDFRVETSFEEGLRKQWEWLQESRRA